MNSDVIVIGGGIVGLATAFQLQKANPYLQIGVLEKENSVASHQTGNNSGVIHSGIYYKPGSLKAINCRTGYQMLLDFCNEHQIKYELCGKLIVATEENEVPALMRIYERGIENGLKGTKLINKDEIKELEPHAKGVKAIQVPETGIVNYLHVSEKLAELISQNEGEVKTGCKVTSIRELNNLIYVETNDKTYQCKLLVNCAGLYSDKIAEMALGKLDIRIVPFRGEYYKIKEEKRYLVKNLIYPVPDPSFPFLGVHFTRRIDGEIEAGPNAVLAFGRESYSKSQVNFNELLETLTWPGFVKVASKYWKTGFGEMYRSFSKTAFTKALQKLLPEIREEDLLPGGAGIRAQACERNGMLTDDFYIKETANMVHVLNAPSPAATSSLAIGKTIADMVLKKI
jgi:(S)-2-hydroxyglutarate dehydrogenase